jgi:dCTP deaminase
LKRARKQVLQPGGTFVIPPGQFAFVETQQIVQVPSDSMAFISIKAKIKFGGLINVSGFHVDPGYRGRLLFSVYNAGPRPIVLAQGQPIFLIWYAYLDNPGVTVGHASRKVRPPDSGKSIDPQLLTENAGEVLSLHSLSEKVSHLSRRVETVFIVGSGLATLILLVAAGIYIFLVQDKFEAAIHKKLDSNTQSSISKTKTSLVQKN